MRVSREKAQENRKQIIEAAARLLREHGFDGIGVADIMKAAGLTHGGFYRNFASKDDLAVKASEHAIADRMALLKNGLAQQQPQDPLRAVVESYLSSAHRDDPGSGCILPALAADAARRDDPALRAVFITTIQYYLDQIAKLSSASPRAGSRHPAAILSEMVGAVILSRVIANDPLAESLVAAVVADIAGPSPRRASDEE
ncbi:TetR/AcrR family transcriptional regulator [Bradyrhizobium hipponense]|uniref:TetR/AcrR family transcriptional regulator n=1 Tax=Bradyrhizobium hipponense TaxID=2605638 RepID=A0A5S4YRY7_9BRAD|nr:TetR/AcrR family transcriptional regulator [Bradyrhizobium hipponense]TYO66125.1 TetR/AcrR family transcriptional regulator [Bradyrhizobium hipponense]